MWKQFYFKQFSLTFIGKNQLIHKEKFNNFTEIQIIKSKNLD